MKIKKKRVEWTSGPLTREARVENVREGENGLKEATLSISSEFMVSRWFGREVLSHEKGAVRLNRMNNGAPLLINHDYDQQVGAWKRDSVTIDADKKMRGDVKFSRSAVGQDVAIDVEDDIRSNTSVSYRVYTYERAIDLENEDDKDDEGYQPNKVYRATDWEPLEGSLVAIGADPDVGLGRNLQRENTIRVIEYDEEDGSTMKTPEELAIEAANAARTAAAAAAAAAPPAAPAAPAAGVDHAAEARIRTEAEEQGRTNEQRRQSEIKAIGERFNLKPEITEKALKDNEPLADFQQRVLGNFDVSMIRTEDQRIGLTPKQSGKFSFTRAINALVTKDWRNAGFERECCDAASTIHERTGLAMEAGSITIPLDVKMHEQRANLTAGAAEGVELVGSDFRGDQFIDALRNEVRVLEAGATVLNGLVGNITIPRQIAAVAAGVAATETATYTEGAPTYDQVTMSPKIISVFQPVSQQLLIQGSPDVEAMLKRDLLFGMGVKMDQQFLYGSGSSGQIDGIENQTGVQAVTFSEISATWAKLVEPETEIANDNVKDGDMKWIVNSKTRGAWKTTEKASSTGIYLWDTRTPEAPCNGYQALVSNQLDSASGTGSAFSEAVFGQWSQALVGFWGGMNILVDPYTLGTTHLTRLIVHQHVDMTVRHGEAFAFIVGIKNAA